MNSIFFGDFLLEAGEIDECQLSEVLDYLADANIPVGKLAIRGGLLKQDQVDQICSAQRSQDLAFGEIAQELGLLNEKQVTQLLHEQSETFLYIGEALVQRGAITEDRASVMLDVYKQQAKTQYDTADTIPEELRSHPFLHPVLEALPRVALRLGRLQIRTAAAQYFSGTLPHPHGTAILVETDPEIRIGFVASDSLINRLASKMLALDGDAITDSDREDALGEFVNILVGLAKAKIEGSGPRIEMGVPETLASCVSRHSGLGALHLQRPETTEHSRVADPPPMGMPIRSEWQPFTLDAPTTTEFERRSANREIVNSFLS